MRGLASLAVLEAIKTPVDDDEMQSRNGRVADTAGKGRMRDEYSMNVESLLSAR
jgi:hypothetical protein